ncbi:MAG TPA: hypothetical protein VHO67_05355 [Polyangia bacterium]|nr:hypothetical protein [Polyangia bacterium]
MSGTGPRWGRRALILTAILVGSYGLAVLVARPHVPDPATNPYTGKRGASLAKSAGLLIRYRRGAEVAAAAPQTALRAGDVLEFKVRADGPAYLEVRFRDGSAAPRTIFPAAGATTTPQVLPGEALPAMETIAPGAGKVVVTAIFSDRPRAVGTPVDGDSRATTAVLSKE